MRELGIWMDGQRIGTLDGTDSRNLQISYAESWASNPSSTPLSVSMPLASPVHSGKTVHAYLWGLLPDNEQVITRWAKSFQCSPQDVFGLLQGVGADVAGAARYQRIDAGLSSEPIETDGFEQLDENGVAELLRSLTNDSTAWHARIRSHWSLAGAQSKFALCFDDITQSWSIPTGRNPTTHIFKPAIAGLRFHDLNEHLCLTAAARLGLPTAISNIARFGSERALVVTRYDRMRVAGIVERIHQEDFCQALGVPPEKKYQADGGPSLEDLVTLLREVEIKSADDDVNTLVRAAAFNWLILGTDAHAKNYSLLLSGRQVRLARLYDLASAAPYGEHTKKLRMSQKIGRDYRPTEISSLHWERLALSARIDSDQLLRDITTMATRLPEVLNEILAPLASSVLTDDERKAAEHIVESIRSWATSRLTKLGSATTN
jgi:serine/threonine-protein kinase HipA